MNTKKPQDKGHTTTGQGQQGGGTGKMDQSQKPMQNNPSQKPQQGPQQGGRTDQTKK